MPLTPTLAMAQERSGCAVDQGQERGTDEIGANRASADRPEAVRPGGDDAAISGAAGGQCIAVTGGDEPVCSGA